MARLVDTVARRLHYPAASGKHGREDATMTIRYTLHQWLPDGTRWISPETFTAADVRHVRQAVIAGFLAGQPRWAEDETGAVIYGLDARGRETMGVPRYTGAAS